MLTAIIFTIIGIIFESRLPSFKQGLYDTRITEGYIGVLANVEEEQLTQVPTLFTQAGAIDVVRESYRGSAVLMISRRSRTVHPSFPRKRESSGAVCPRVPKGVSLLIAGFGAGAVARLAAGAVPPAATRWTSSTSSTTSSPTSPTNRLALAGVEGRRGLLPAAAQHHRRLRRAPLRGQLPDVPRHGTAKATAAGAPADDQTATVGTTTNTILARPSSLGLPT